MTGRLPAHTPPTQDACATPGSDEAARVAAFNDTAAPLLFMENRGQVTDQHPGIVVSKTGIGGTRVVDMQIGEQLPRIC